MSQIVFSRIDNRLVHGQIATLWSKSVGSNLLVVVDDETANNATQQGIMKMTVDAMGLDVRFFTVQKTIDVIDKAAAHQKIFMVAKDPKTFRQLAEGGVKFTKLNIGNMHYGAGREKIAKKVFVSEEDLRDFEILLNKDVELFVQDTPDDHKKKITKENVWKLH